MCHLHCRVYTINSVYEKWDNKRHRKLDLFFLSIHIQGNPAVDKVLSVKSNLTIIDHYSFKSSICHKMTLLVSLQPLVDSSNPLHRPVIPFTQMTSVSKAEVAPREQELRVILTP